MAKTEGDDALAKSGAKRSAEGEAGGDEAAAKRVKMEEPAPEVPKIGTNWQGACDICRLMDSMIALPVPPSTAAAAQLLPHPPESSWSSKWPECLGRPLKMSADLQAAADVKMEGCSSAVRRCIGRCVIIAAKCV